MVASPDVHFPGQEMLKNNINRFTRAADNRFIDAIGLAERHFGDHMAANLIVLGVAYQTGLIPVSAAAIERAITLNGVAVQMNTHAFRLGRQIAIDPNWAPGSAIDASQATVTAPALSATARELIDLIAGGATLSAELRRLIEIRLPILIEYQNSAYARQYALFLKQVYVTEQTVTAGKTVLSEAVARYLFKLMAYKDEYEVARLFLQSEQATQLAETYGRDATIHYHLHPPFLRALGWQKKIKFGKWFTLGYHILMRAKRLRGTRLDLFGYAHVRRVERALIGEYRALIEQQLATLSPDTYEHAVKLATLPDLIRGYEEVKLRNVERFRKEVREQGLA
jgi:indolepyruvate ferredoxin oxidoreductase